MAFILSWWKSMHYTLRQKSNFCSKFNLNTLKLAKRLIWIFALKCAIFVKIVKNDLFNSFAIVCSSGKTQKFNGDFGM